MTSTPMGGFRTHFNATEANRFIHYVATNIQDMHAWIGSEVVTGGLDEPTMERESQYPAPEQEPSNGTMMTVSQVRGGLGRDQAGAGGCIAERFEVAPDLQAEFDAWLEGPHLEAYEAMDGWARIRTFHGDRTADHTFPWNRYLGKGNRMIWAELADRVDPKEFVRREAYRLILADSLRWDSRLSYVTREACEGFIVRDLSQIPSAV